MSFDGTIFDPCQSCPLTDDLHTSVSVPSCSAHRRKLKSKFAVWRLASWNVRSLLDIDGSVETARQGRVSHNAEDRKVDRVISEFRR